MAVLIASNLPVVNSDTFHSIGIVWDILGDADHNATVTVQYRKVGDGAWSDGSDLLRTDWQWYDSNNYPPTQPALNNFAGSLMFLTPGTAYDLKLTYTDPDAVEQTRVVELTAATRAIPVKPTGGTTYYVESGHGGTNSGTVANPWLTINDAQATVVAGDIVKIRTGTGAYAKGTLTTAGAEDNHIVYEADTAASPVLDGLALAADHVWIGSGLSFVWDDKSSDLQTFDDGDVTAGTDRITLASHTFITDDVVYLTTTGTLPSGLVDKERYWVEKIDGNTVELKSDPVNDDGLTVDITAADGSGTHTISIHPSDQATSVTSAIYLNASGLNLDDIVIEGNTFDGFYNGLFALYPVTRFVVMDNDFVGWQIEDVAGGPTLLGFGSDGIGIMMGAENSWQRSSEFYYPPSNALQNCVIAYNNVTRFADSMGYFETTDVYSNRGWDNTGNSQSDGAWMNVRVWGNLFQYNHNGPLSLQPQRAGPWYHLYNQYAQTNNGIFKTQINDRNVLVNNTFIGGIGKANQHMRNYQRNNIFARNGNNSGACWNSSLDGPPTQVSGLLVADWQTDIDYDGWIAGTGGNFFNWHDVTTPANYSTLASWTTQVTTGGNAPEANGTELTHAVFDGIADAAAFYAALDPQVSLELKSDGDYGSANPAVQAGVVVDNLSDWHGAVPGTTAPDLGAHQRGATALHYGPRTITTALDQRTDYWSKH